MRRTAAAMLGAFYRPRHTRAGRDGLDVLSDAASAAAQVAADALNSGRLADARRWARAYALLDASHQRLINRRMRDWKKGRS